MGNIYRVFKGDTRSEDHSSNGTGEAVQLFLYDSRMHLSRKASAQTVAALSQLLDHRICFDSNGKLQLSSRRSTAKSELMHLASWLTSGCPGMFIAQGCVPLKFLDRGFSVGPVLMSHSEHCLHHTDFWLILQQHPAQHLQLTSGHVSLALS